MYIIQVHVPRASQFQPMAHTRYLLEHALLQDERRYSKQPIGLLSGKEA